MKNAGMNLPKGGEKMIQDKITQDYTEIERIVEFKNRFGHIIDLDFRTEGMFVCIKPEIPVASSFRRGPVYTERELQIYAQGVEDGANNSNPATTNLFSSKD